MDKALVVGTKDCRLESCQGHCASSCALSGGQLATRVANSPCNTRTNRSARCRCLGAVLQGESRFLQVAPGGTSSRAAAPIPGNVEHGALPHRRHRRCGAACLSNVERNPMTPTLWPPAWKAPPSTSPKALARVPRRCRSCGVGSRRHGGPCRCSRSGCGVAAMEAWRALRR